MFCYCSVGLHNECVSVVANDDGSYDCCCTVSDTVENTISVPLEVEKHTRALKPDSEVEDILSTGRKRATALFPISDGMVCEWAFLLNAGGGPFPIVGCKGNTLYVERGKSAVHHGPDKNTLNNVVGNVHRICPLCHNRWHTLNDPMYGKRPPDGTTFLPLGGLSLPHDSDTKATPEQIEYSETWWATPPKLRGPYRE